MLRACVLVAALLVAGNRGSAENGVKVTGQVVGPEGQPVPGAEVGALGQWNYAESLDDVYTAAADDQGLFELDLGVGAQRLYGSWSLWARDKDRELIGATIMQGSEGLGDPAEIRLAEGAYVHSSIVDQEGHPLPGLETEIAVHPGLAGLIRGPKTDENGEVAIGPLPTGVELVIEPPGDVYHLSLNSTWWRGRKAEITLKPGEVYELPTLVVDPEGRSAEGIVMDEQGRPVAGARVVPFRPTVPRNEVFTDEQGRFTLTRLAIRGEVWIVASHATEPHHAAVQIDPDEGEPLEIVLKPAATVRGQVVDGEGRAIQGARVRAIRMLRIGDTTSIWNAAWIPEPEPVATDADGFWSIDGLVSGAPYALSVQAEGLRYDPFQAKFVADADEPLGLGMVSPME